MFRRQSSLLSAQPPLHGRAGPTGLWRARAASAPGHARLVLGLEGCRDGRGRSPPEPEAQVRVEGGKDAAGSVQFRGAQYSTASCPPRG
jgi:hypothetical protein